MSDYATGYSEGEAAAKHHPGYALSIAADLDPEQGGEFAAGFMDALLMNAVGRPVTFRFGSGFYIVKGNA